MLACGFCVSRKGVTEGGGWGHPQGDMHMVAAKLGFERAVVWTDGPPLTLTAWTGSENTTFTLQRAGFWQEGCLGSERVYGNR